MALRLQRCTTARAVQARPSRRSTVRVAAWQGDNSSPFAGLLRILTPARWLSNNKEDSFPESPFTGKIPSRERKPFKDGFIAKELPKGTQAAEEAAQGEGILEYLNDAAERVVKHNFVGESTEPDWTATGQKGWKGDTRKGREQKDNGFHSTTY